MGNPPQENEDFARLFEEMADLLQYTLENADKPLKDELPKDLEKRLSQLEQDVEAFCEMNAAMIETSKDQGKGTRDAEHLTKKERKILERTEKLVKESEVKQKDLAEIGQPGKTIIEDKDKERRKHAKRIGRKRI